MKAIMREFGADGARPIRLVRLAAGMAMIGGSTVWATAVTVHGHFWANLAGPLFISGAGTAFAFIPISIAGLAGVPEHETGLASGLLNASQRIGGAIGVAVASTVFATHTKMLLHSGHTAPAALTGGFQWAFWFCGAVGLAGVPFTLLLVRRSEINETLARAAVIPAAAPTPALAATD